MESQEPTQPSTQQMVDPRRLGRNNSGLVDDDVTDVILILHPTTPCAMRIVENMSRMRPEHVLFYDQVMTSFVGHAENIEEQETIIIDKDGQRVGQSSSAAVGLALRLSSASLLKSKQDGFIFGRNMAISDIVLGQDSGRRISNQHFRIFFNENGLTMLADTSTNGTLVDNVLLKGKDPKFNPARMIVAGTMITISNTNDAETIRFTVRIPPRGPDTALYEEKKRLFISECSNGGNKMRALQKLQQQPYRATMRWDGGNLYNIIGELGKGAFATVYQLATKMDGRVLAAKELEKRRFMKNGHLDQKIENEMKIMESLRHPNIIEFVEYHDQGDYLYIVMEYAPHGDMQKFLNEHGPINEDMARPLAQQTLSALNYLHNAKITHRDIKPDNILISSLDPLQVKLSDFGLSKVIKHDETFLKTFCGTLLYCAPEVFPDFQNQGTKRRRGKQYNAYSSSVDIWSFGGVLWFSLCGEPPFRGIADATGEAMYKNIMSTKLDPTPLKERNVSDECIELLTMMLTIDPSLRPTEWECLNHRWLKDGNVPDLKDPNLQSILEEDEDAAEAQLSQLSLGNEIPESDEEADVLSDEFEMLLDSRQSKRIRTDPLFPRNQMRDYEDDSSAEPSFLSDHDMSHALEAEESFNVIPMSDRQRLFGEIGQSALQSSQIYNEQVKEALTGESSASERLVEILPSSSHIGGQGGRQTPPAARAVPRLDSESRSRSLLGAESMVREFNMASPHSPVSRTQSPVEPATPKTPDIPQHNSLEYSSKRVSQNSEPTPRAKPTLDRQISLPKTASLYWDPYNKETHTLEYASKVSGFDFVNAQQEAVAAADIEDTMRQSESSEPNDDAAQASPVALPQIPAEKGFKSPPRRLGKLTATADSFAPNLVLNIETSKTSWGRLNTNSIVYENAKDIRVPKTAFIIFFWAAHDKNAVENLSQKGEDWTTLSDLHVGIFTRASSGISVNGKHFRKTDEKNRILYGKLHTGDIVQVFHDPRTNQCLRFKCEFYLSDSKNPRLPGNSFQTFRNESGPK
ncbi:Pkinase-domain-containing protein [Periconia macrospinosa]|uniref:Pkinase-domain-containing protein n=1 Tax=Periconia macrospinosa TaxID=97972 RepID=A0A2V1DNG7_9PLEO|nr:Pkinase-domain-containing protein [Periconia macrospinosa]